MPTESKASTENSPQSPRVYQAINAIQAELAKEGIGKDRKNEQQNYKFRGIDDVYNAVSPLLARHGLCIMPRCTERDCVERTNAKGTALFYVTVRAEFDFVAAADASRHTVVTYGEAMDSGDKATNKAMSAAYKYALMQAFAIPTEGDNDADATTHEVAPRPNTATQVARDEFMAMSDDERDLLQQWANELKAVFSNGGNMVAKMASFGDLSQEHKLALWSLLPSNVRSEFKRQSKPALAEQA